MIATMHAAAAHRPRPSLRARAARLYRRFLRLSSAERGLLLQSALAVVVVRVALSLLPARRAMSATLRLQRWCAAAGRDAGWPPDRIAWSVRVASRGVPGATCLTQALATQALLALAGRSSRLRIGVGRDEDGTFRAHAWVEVDDRVVIGGGRLDRFARLPDLDTTV